MSLDSDEYFEERIDANRNNQQMRFRQKSGGELNRTISTRDES